MRKPTFIALVIGLFALCSLASAQQGDAYIGGGTLLSSSASAPLILGTNCGLSSSGNAVCPEKGGFYMLPAEGSGRAARIARAFCGQINRALLASLSLRR